MFLIQEEEFNCRTVIILNLQSEHKNLHDVSHCFSFNQVDPWLLMKVLGLEPQLTTRWSTYTVSVMLQ